MIQFNIEKEQNITVSKLYYNNDTHIKYQNIKISNHQDQILEYNGAVLSHKKIIVNYLYTVVCS